MKIATWNVNSLTARLPHVIDWLAANPVDVLGLQELKTVDEKFPFEALQQAGYQTTAPAAEAITQQVQATMGAFYKPEAAQELLAQGLADSLPLADYLR